MALEQLALGTGLNKVDTAINLLREHEPPEGYYLAFSGGKDSVAIKHLADKAGVKYDAHYCVSPIDPPEIYRFIKEYYPDVIWDYHAKGWWKKVTIKHLPLRRRRWCCAFIKESGGVGRVVITGARASESNSRKKNRYYEYSEALKKTFLRPILLFSDNDVWQYLNENELPRCSLYAEGFDRIGCILCPMASRENRLRELERFPKVSYLWRLAADRIVERRQSLGRGGFKTGQEYFAWWLLSDKKKGLIDFNNTK